MGEVETVRPYAGFWRRVAAVLLDGLILMVVNGLLSAVFTLGGDKISLIGQVVTSLLGIIYYVYFIGSCGQTPGKMVLKIKVQKISDGSLVGYRGAFMREVLGKFVSGIVFGLGYLWMIKDKDKQTWHDKIAKTVVVKI